MALASLELLLWETGEIGNKAKSLRSNIVRENIGREGREQSAIKSQIRENIADEDAVGWATKTCGAVDDDAKVDDTDAGMVEADIADK